MKKRSKAARFGVLALSLSLVTVGLLGSTMARYVTEISGTATADVAAWSFKVKDGGNEIASIDLGDTTHRTSYTQATVKEGVIAPGTSGKFELELDASGSEVGVDYKITVQDAYTAGGTEYADIPEDMVFSESAFDNSNTGKKLGEFAITPGTIDYNGSNMKKTITVYWAWGLDDNSSDNASSTKNTRDTSLAGKKFGLNITVTGKQVNPKTTTP